MKKRIVLKPSKKKSKKILSPKKSLSIIIFCLILNFSLISFIIIPSYSLEENNINDSQDETKNVEVIVNYKENLTIPFLSEYKVSDFIEYINGEIIDDYVIDTSKLGMNKISFDYINTQNIKVTSFFELNITDDVAPVIWLENTKTITTNYSGNLIDDIVCADNIDDNPQCEIIGYYDTNKVGKYQLTFKATDKSGNETIKNFILNVTEPSEKKNSTSSSTSQKKQFKDIVKEYKTSKTKIGIDVSSWQGDIDYEAVKNAGVEFAFIRVGSTYGINGEYFLDKKFKKNIEGFTNVGIPVGIYFYSYANSKESAIKDAKWVLSQIKDYNIDLPVVYDWESWSFYNEFNQSFYSLTQSAKSYLDTISNAGYQGMLYSSKNYLEKVWYNTGYDIWLAHYTEQTSYKGEYSYWQLCSNGQVDGISGNVDINIYYEK